MRDAVAAGIRTFGRIVSGGLAKRPQVEGAGMTWHLVGPLQSNKARKAVETFDVIQTVDSVDLARRIDSIVGGAGGTRRYPVLLQVNVDADPAKSGLHPPDVEPALAEIAALHHVAVEGLMTVGRLVDTADAARPTSGPCAAIGAAARCRWPGSGGVVDGHDRRLRGRCRRGATIVRVGRAISGRAPHHHALAEPQHSHPR